MTCCLCAASLLCSGATGLPGTSDQCGWPPLQPCPSLLQADGSCAPAAAHELHQRGHRGASLSAGGLPGGLWECAADQSHMDGGHQHAGGLLFLSLASSNSIQGPGWRVYPSKCMSSSPYGRWPPTCRWVLVPAVCELHQPTWPGVARGLGDWHCLMPLQTE